MANRPITSVDPSGFQILDPKKIPPIGEPGCVAICKSAIALVENEISSLEGRIKIEKFWVGQYQSKIQTYKEQYERYKNPKSLNDIDLKYHYKELIEGAEECLTRVERYLKKLEEALKNEKESLKIWKERLAACQKAAELGKNK